MADNLVVDKLYTAVLNDQQGRARQQWELIDIVEPSNGRFSVGGWTRASSSGYVYEPVGTPRPFPTLENLGYRQIKIILNGLTATTDNVNVRIQWVKEGSSGWYGSSTYRWVAARGYRTTIANGFNTVQPTNASYYEIITGLGNHAGAAVYGEMIFDNPFAQREEATDQDCLTRFQVSSADYGGTYGILTSFGAAMNHQADMNIDGVNIYPSAGSFDGGNVYVYASRTGSVPRAAKSA